MGSRARSRGPAPISKHPWYKYFLAVLDWVILVAAFIVSSNLREHTFAAGVLVLEPASFAEVAFYAGYGAVSVLVFQHFYLYKVNVFTTLVDHTVQLLKALVTVVAGLALLSFFTKATWISDSRLAAIYFLIGSFTALLLVRVVVFRKLFQWVASQDLVPRSLLIVGAGPTGRDLAVSVTMNRPGGLRLAGFLDDEEPIGKTVFAGAKIIGRVDELAELVPVFEIDEILICLEKVGYTRLMHVIEHATATTAGVKISSPLYDVIPSRLFIEKYGKFPVVGISHVEPGQVQRFYKRIFDLAGAAVGILLLLPLWVAIAVAIKGDSRGPVLFRQKRIGKNGKPFIFYKFRSMTVGSEQDKEREQRATQFVRTRRTALPQEVSTKIVNDDRVTRVGRWLRKTSMDELPQLWNVLKGEMSLVGPRPCLPYEWEHYEEWHKRRLSVLPGCTGMWQVSGRSTVGFEDMVVLDLYYIQNSSFLLDLRLLVKTVPVVLLGTGGK